MTCYPREEAQREVAFIAYHFHWSRDELLRISHIERRLWVENISRINEEANAAALEAAR